MAPAVWEHSTSPRLGHLLSAEARRGRGGFRGRRFPRSVMVEGTSSAWELLWEQAEEEPGEQAYASSFPLFNDPFIHL